VHAPLLLVRKGKWQSRTTAPGIFLHRKFAPSWSECVSEKKKTTAHPCRHARVRPSRSSARGAFAPSSCIEPAADALGGGGGRSGGGGCRRRKRRADAAHRRAARWYDLGRDQSWWKENGRKAPPLHVLRGNSNYIKIFIRVIKNQASVLISPRVLQIGDTSQYSFCFESAMDRTEGQ